MRAVVRGSDTCLHVAILLQFRYTASVKKADKLNPHKPRKGQEANKFFGLIVMKYVDNERSLFSLAYGLEDICIPARAIAWIELVEG